MRPTQQSIIEAIEKVAEALDDLKEEVAVVGGAVVGLYADGPAAPDVRPTKDVDLVFEIANYKELRGLEKKLVARGFKHAKDEKVLCRFQYENILVDIMATKEVRWAPANPWFESGFKQLINYTLKKTTIKILPFAYFLATKISAFLDRGKDPRVDPDFEDIVYLLDNRSTFVTDILESDEDVRSYLISELKALLNDVSLQEAVQGHLEPAKQTERFKMIIDKIVKVVE